MITVLLLWINAHYKMDYEPLAPIAAFLDVILINYY